MEAILILLGALVLAGVLLWGLDHLQGRTSRNAMGDIDVAGPSENPTQSDLHIENPTQSHGNQECVADCALRSVCPSEEMLRNERAAENVYYEDEELDAFAGRAADSYTPEEVEQWRDILYTLRPEEVVPWTHSLHRRGIAIPTALRDELLSLVKR